MSLRLSIFGERFNERKKLEFQKQIQELTPENVSEFNFKFLKKNVISEQIYFDLLTKLFTWDDQYENLRNEIIKKHFSKDVCFSYLITSFYNEKVNSHDISKQSLSLLKNNTLDNDDIYSLFSSFFYSYFNGYLSYTKKNNGALELFKCLDVDFQNKYLFRTISKFLNDRSNNDNILNNIQSLSNSLVSKEQTNNEDIFSLKLNSYIKEVTSNRNFLNECSHFFSKCLNHNAVNLNTIIDEIFQDGFFSQFNKADLIILGMLKDSIPITKLLANNPDLLFLKNHFGISPISLIDKSSMNNEFIKILTQLDQDVFIKNLNTSLFAYMADRTGEQIFIERLTDPKCEFLKENAVLDSSFFNNKINILIPSARGILSPSLMKMIESIEKNDKDINHEIKFWFINQKNWNKFDKNLLAKFNGIILPGAADNFPEKQKFNLNNLNDDHLLPITKLSIEMAKFAKIHNIPTLGFCAGAQNYVLSSGGSLNYVKDGIESENLKIELKVGTIPHYMSLHKNQKEIAFDGREKFHTENIQFNAYVNCGFTADHSGFKKFILAATHKSIAGDMDHPMCYSSGLSFVTQYHPERAYIGTNEPNNYQENFINSFFDFVRIHQKHGSQYLINHINDIEMKLSNIYGPYQETTDNTGTLISNISNLIENYKSDPATHFNFTAVDSDSKKVISLEDHKNITSTENLLSGLSFIAQPHPEKVQIEIDKPNQKNYINSFFDFVNNIGSQLLSIFVTNQGVTDDASALIGEIVHIIEDCESAFAI